MGDVILLSLWNTLFHYEILCFTMKHFAEEAEHILKIRKPSERFMSKIKRWRCFNKSTKQQHPPVERQNHYYQNKIYDQFSNNSPRKTSIIYEMSNEKNNNKPTHSKKMLLCCTALHMYAMQCNATSPSSINVEGRNIATIRKINSNFTSHRT